MNKLFSSYEELYKTYDSNLREHNHKISRQLRVFDIRFRLAIDLKIDYIGEVSYVKTKDVKETYILTLKLMDLWNSYEALVKYVSKELKHSLVKCAPDTFKNAAHRTTVENYYNKTTSLDSLKFVAENFKKKAKENEKFKKDFKAYVDRISKDNSKSIESHIKNQAVSLYEFIEFDKDISGIEILSLIYAERNMYFHDGEPCKMGISYASRKYLLSTYYNCLEEVILKSAIFVLSKLNKEVNKLNK